MNKTTLLTMLMVVATACAIASGETFVKTSKGDGKATVVVTATASSASSDGGGWLGVRIMPIPAPLAAHLKTGNAGAMIANLVKSSPAHKAGLKRYDVIVGLDDDDVKDGPGLIKAVRRRKAGEKVNLSVIRKGRKTNKPIVLGKPVPADKAELVHKEDALNVFRDTTRIHPHIMLRKKAGDWEKMEGKDLPEEIRKLLKSMPMINLAPGSKSGVHVKAKTVISTKDSNGHEVRIEQDETGKITVTRKVRWGDGNETEKTKTYKNRDELRLTDKEAFDLLKKSNVTVHTSVGPGKFKLDVPGRGPFGGQGKIDPHKLRADILEQLRKSFEKMDLPDDLRKKLNDQLKIEIRIHQDDGDTDDKADKPKAGKSRERKSRKDRKARDRKGRDRKAKDRNTLDKAPPKTASPGDAHV